MKTLILNGSPRKKGDSQFIIDKIKDKLEGEITVINVYEEKASPCIDCRYCWSHAECVIKDDMNKCYDLMNKVDNIIMASPIYFSELTGPLLSYTSRFQRYYAEMFFMKDHEFVMKDKKGILILTAGGDMNGAKRCITTAKIILKHVNTKILGTITTLQTNDVPAKDDPSIDAQVDEAIKLLTES